MRGLATLLILLALAAPFGDAGASGADASPGLEACDLRGEIRADLAGGQDDPLGPDLLGPFALAAPAPAGVSSGGSDGPRRVLTVLPHGARLASPGRARSPSLRRRWDPAGLAALGPSLRVYSAHRSTAPPSVA